MISLLWLTARSASVSRLRARLLVLSGVVPPCPRIAAIMHQP